MVESKSATWQRCDLRTTRVKDPDRGQLLIFKELEWQTVRIEAQSTKDKNLTPLRLLTNQARCRITIKKRISGLYNVNNDKYRCAGCVSFTILFCRLLCYGL